MFIAQKKATTCRLLRLFSTSFTSFGVSAGKQFQGADIGHHLNDYDLFATLDRPENNIEMISKDAVIFSNMQVIRSPNKQKEPIGALLLNNQIFEVNLKKCHFTDNDLVFHMDPEISELFRIIYPKPELLVVGLGKKTRLVSKSTRDSFNKLGIRLETSDTRYSALNYDMLATERTPTLVAALILPPNW
ncbi:DEKNAAC100100 [Brettanomyces naardenensis]|uniref:DEKNAAC100100 n=1 Tax=Brettanomyces naardenensis TaxID=13370 RepID=A0A448YFK6_BRENA|nr:DEKNAAC100100 [Brettanomyces naardenensis]